ncbi:MAG: metallophosphoesterase [Deltaproteobacteria bacterium]|nr:metallophosphoesterase [Deltaproteobacteria bacterium]
MYLFLITFFLVYVSMHFYLFLKAKAAFTFGPLVSIPLILFMAGMVFSPLTIRSLERYGLESAARLTAYIGYTWMGVLFLFVSASILIDLCRKTGLLRIPPRISFFIPILISMSIATYGYFEALDIRTEMVIVKTPKIPKSIGRLRVVQISDVHLGLIVREERLKRILNEVKSAEPDLLVSTGDMVDGQIDNLTGLAELLNEISPRYGKFAVTGNHEFYAGLANSLDFTKKAGFKVLRGESISVAGILNIAGVDDPAGKPFGLFADIQEKGLLSTLPQETFTLLLKHRPEVDKDARGLFDLQLSGHVHKGQIFPFSIITRLFYPVRAGEMNVIDGASLYVSRGSGTWGPPIRFLSPPEVTVIDIMSN